MRYGLRTLLKNPGFTVVAVSALALGIGANSAIFSVVNAVLLRPLSFKNPKQLVMVWENATHLGFPKNTPAPPNFLDWQRQNTVFTGMAALVERSFNLTGVGEPERLDGRRVSANLFDVLGVPPLVGRTFVPDDDRAGAASFSELLALATPLRFRSRHTWPGSDVEWGKLHGDRRDAALGALARLWQLE